MQAAQVGVADVDVLGGRVGVQLLVPLLKEFLLDALQLARLGSCYSIKVSRRKAVLLQKHLTGPRLDGCSLESKAIKQKLIGAGS